MVSISAETPHQSDVLDLLRAGDEFALALYPTENYYGLGLDELGRPGVTLLVARDAATAVGTAALVERGDGTAELKRMFVSPAARGLGVASALMVAVEERARAASIGLVQLETGLPQAAAIALYTKHGYRHIAQFGQYVGDPTSVCMEKSLTPVP